MELSKVTDETRNIGDTWEDLDDTGRKAILDYRVYDVLIVVESIPGMKEANRKTALVTLRTAPNAPIALPLGAQRSRANAASSRTHGSSSDSRSDSRPSAAATDPTCPSAQAACPRKSDSGSESARPSVEWTNPLGRLPASASGDSAATREANEGER